MGQRPNEKNLKEVLPSSLRILRKFSPYIHKRKVVIVASLFALLFETGLRLLEPWPLKYIFDYVLVPAYNNSPDVANPFGLSPIVLLTFLALATIGIAVVGSVASYLSTYGMSLAVVQILSEVRGTLFDRLQHLSLSFHQQFKSGDLITRVTADIEKMRIVITKTTLPL